MSIERNPTPEEFFDAECSSGSRALRVNQVSYYPPRGRELIHNRVGICHQDVEGQLTLMRNGGYFLGSLSLDSFSAPDTNAGREVDLVLGSLKNSSRSIGAVSSVGNYDPGNRVSIYLGSGTDDNPERWTVHCDLSDVDAQE